MLTGISSFYSQGVYCKAHAPRVEKFALDENCIEIRSAVAAQRISQVQGFNKQVHTALVDPGAQRSHPQPACTQPTHFSANIKKKSKFSLRPSPTKNNFLDHTHPSLVFGHHGRVCKWRSFVAPVGSPQVHLQLGSQRQREVTKTAHTRKGTL